MDNVFSTHEYIMLKEAIRREKEICKDLQPENDDCLERIADSIENKIYDIQHPEEKIKLSAAKRFADDIMFLLTREIMGYMRDINAGENDDRMQGIETGLAIARSMINKKITDMEVQYEQAKKN